MNIIEADRIRVEIVKNFGQVIGNYKAIETNLDNIVSDLKIIEDMHKKYVATYDVNLHGSYIDDIYHQIDILKLEYRVMDIVNSKNINKFYRDLFKLYCKVVKNIIGICRENKEIILKINGAEKDFKISYETEEFKKLKNTVKVLLQNPHRNDDIFETIKKNCYAKIKIFSELENINYNVKEIEAIFMIIEKRLDELLVMVEFVKLNIADVKNKTEKGIVGQTYIIDLNSKHDRIISEYQNYVNLIMSIVNIHLVLSLRYKQKTDSIAGEVEWDDDLQENNYGKKNSSNLIIEKE